MINTVSVQQFSDALSIYALPWMHLNKEVFYYCFDF